MQKYKILFFTGAGISAASGIPTFQVQEGIRDKLTRDFANEHPEEYRETIRSMKEICDKAQPNAAHLAIAKYNFPVITMNVDQLHTKAGSTNVTEVHGVLPTIKELNEPDFPLMYDKLVLYGDIAPQYEVATKMVKSLEYGNSFFIIVGTSFYTAISDVLHRLAKKQKAKVIIVNDNAVERVPKICESLKNLL